MSNDVKKALLVEVHLTAQSNPVVINNVKNTYQKGDLFCVMLDNGIVYKFPIVNIFRIKESEMKGS